ncbi:MAG: class I SAM-dependent methyltransferase [SAR202 cluster bacterium]|nr:class I SAM-dependent methyltransferase [SAR202 cluster bacterium]
MATETIQRSVTNIATDTLERATFTYMQELDQIEARCEESQTFDMKVYQRVLNSTRKILTATAEFERIASAEQVSKARQLFRRQTEPWFSKSYFTNRARHWPYGYAGDFETLEGTYFGAPMTHEGIGMYLDTYFMSRQLAIAVRERRAMLAQMLSATLQSLPQRAKVLNLGCGSCRELFDIGPDIVRYEPQLTCLDSEQVALDYAGRLLLSNGVSPENLTLMKYNVMRLVNRGRNLKVFGSQDVIYTAGLFDYIIEDRMIRLLGSLYDLLTPGGTLIAPLPDSQLYDVQDLHWLLDWETVLPVTASKSRSYFDNAGIPKESIQTIRDKTGVMIFYVVTRE